MDKKRILFLTGTRADFGKLKPLIRAVDEDPGFDGHIFVTGMHLLAKYGETYLEVVKEGFSNIHPYMNQMVGETMDMVLSNTVAGLSRYISESRPDMIVVHGDRLEALAGAIVGALRNILVCHIEGGERSGTVDEMIRHSVTKLAHIHCVANAEAAKRLYQLGEDPKAVFIIGSPDIDIMLSDELPDMDKLKRHYDIPFEEYGIVLYHPVTTQPAAEVRRRAEALVDGLLASSQRCVVIYPNNDMHGEQILAAYERLAGDPRFRIYPSMRFEYFLTLLKNARFIVGNSSAGIREAPVYCVPAVNLGSRQAGRFSCASILSVDEEAEAIRAAMDQAAAMVSCKQCLYFGKGESKALFLQLLQKPEVWAIPTQKSFRDLSFPAQEPASGAER